MRRNFTKFVNEKQAIKSNKYGCKTVYKIIKLFETLYSLVNCINILIIMTFLLHCFYL